MLIKQLDLMQSVKSEDFGHILNAIIHSSHGGIFVADHKGDIVMVNKASADMNGLCIDDLLDKNVLKFLKEGVCSRSVTLEVLKEKKTISLINITKENKRILTTGIPIFDDSKQIKFVLVNERDITSLNDLNRLLEKKDSYKPISEIGSEPVADELKDWIFESIDMRIIVQSAIRVAKYDLDVLITGESGVGKGVIAKLIQKISNRKEGPFIDVNCSTISGNLMESELFGYGKGAFTGANVEGQIGFLESGNHGTVFLDEIGEIPFQLQAKLLKFIESKEIIRVGSVKPITIDTRIIAATNRDLSAMVEAGEFRKDLFFRLNVFPITIPPLRERKVDIEPLIKLFLNSYNERYHFSKKISKEAISALVQYDFPGNVRELKNLINRAMILTKGNTIKLTHFPEPILDNAISVNGIDIKRTNSLQSMISDFETKLIFKTIQRFGSQRKAAQHLGVDQSTLSRKLNKSRPKTFVHE